MPKLTQRDFTDAVIKSHLFCFNPQDNGGEGLTLLTKFIHNGDPGPDGIYWNQVLTLLSYGNSASFQLFGTSITPEMLRKLADELERAQAEAVSLKEKMEADSGC